MIEEEIYSLWAPLDNPWSPWVKPVLFTQLRQVADNPVSYIPAKVQWPNAADLAARRLAIVLDVRGELAVALGLQLANAGFRPIPLFNTSYGPNAVVPVQGILHALHEGASLLGKIRLQPDAPPVFLLDAKRMEATGPVVPGKYDNRWLVFPQDFPSATFLLAQKITGIVLIQEQGDQPQSDLAHTLLRWQETGIPILSATLMHLLVPEVIQVKRPPRYRALWHHFLALIGLHRHGGGGFGAVIPEPSQGGGYG